MCASNANVHGNLAQVSGEYAKDVLHLGDDLSVPDQVFAAVTSFHAVQACQGEEGLLGLLFSGGKGAKFPTVVDNLKAQLRHPIFSLYLDKIDDYPEDPGQPERDPANGPGHEYDGTADAASYRPQAADSEIIFGGVNHKHYKDCLKWHDSTDMDGADIFWNFRLEAVRAFDKDLSGGGVAIIDSGSTFIEGPMDAIAEFAVQNKIECFDLDDFGNAYIVQCDGGFDAAATNCSNNLEPLKFIAEDGSSYELGAEELFMKVDTVSGEICFLRILGSPGLPGWILGDAFLDRYYTAFNFVDKRIGLAETATENGGSICAEDWPLDIAYDGGPAPAPSPTKESFVPPKIGGNPSPAVASSKSSPYSDGGGSSSMNASIGMAVAVVVAAILMVSVISCRRRRRYQRADRYDDQGYSNEDVEEMELPGLL